MAGIHGKNAVLRVGSAETVLSGAAMPQIGSTGKYQIADGSRNWKYDRDRTLIAYYGSSGEKLYLNTQTRLINYAGGAIFGNSAPGAHIASGFYAAHAVSMTLNTVAELVGDARNFSVSLSADTVDTTTIGESWKTFEDGLLGFEGSLDGLYINDFWYKKAVSTLSGLIPQNVLKLQMNPKDTTDYYQGTVIFPNWELSGGYDSAIEHSVEFQGRGPLDFIENGVPFFKIHETT